MSMHNCTVILWRWLLAQLFRLEMAIRAVDWPKLHTFNRWLLLRTFLLNRKSDISIENISFSLLLALWSQLGSSSIKISNGKITIADEQTTCLFQFFLVSSFFDKQHSHNYLVCINQKIIARVFFCKCVASRIERSVSLVWNVLWKIFNFFFFCLFRPI